MEEEDGGKNDDQLPGRAGHIYLSKMANTT